MLKKMLKITEELVADDERIKMIIKMKYFVQIDNGLLDPEQAVKLMTGELLDYAAGDVTSCGRKTVVKLMEDIGKAFSGFSEKEMTEVRRFVGL